MTDFEIDSLYKTGMPISHAAGLWAVYAQGLEDALATMTACTCGATVATVATVAPVAPVATVADQPSVATVATVTVIADEPVVLPDPPLAA